MNKPHKLQTFEREGRINLEGVIKNVKSYMRGLLSNGTPCPNKIVFFTLKGEGPMMAFSQLSDFDPVIIAVMFPRTYSAVLKDGRSYTPEIPDKVVKFFAGVGIPVIRGRLPFDEMLEAELHNREMRMLKNALAVFGGSVPLAIQAVLQATDNGVVSQGEEVIAVTGDTALVITASTSRDFLSKKCGLIVNDIICKPRNFTITRPAPKPPEESVLLKHLSQEGELSKEASAIPVSEE